MEKRVITPNAIGEMFGNVKVVEITSDAIVVTKKRGYVVTLNCSEISDIPSVTKGIFSSRLNFEIQGRKRSFSFLNRFQVRSSLKFIEEISIQNISRSINKAHTKFLEKAIHEYLRDSSIEALEEAIGHTLSSYRKSRKKWRSKFSEDELSKLLAWERYFPLSKGKKKLREAYEFQRLESREQFFNVIESNPLTEQQRLSVIRNNDLNLVLAAAGTGKTSVMVAKALDLIDSQAAVSSEILILAYNNAAAKELEERVTIRGKASGIPEESNPIVSTFHALGRKILRDSGIPTYLSDFADDSIKLETWVTNWMLEYIKASPTSLTNFIQLLYQPISPFDFSTKEEYDAYVRDNDYRTLQGERVKGYQELIIANWLFMNGVEYEYEAPYVTKRRLDPGFDYRPDFHIKNTPIYLEHFGIDRSGNTREDIDQEQYRAEIEKKRLLHEESETTLLETFHYDWTENNLENRLADLMAESEVLTDSKSPEEMFETLKESGLIAEGVKRYTACLKAIRVERLDKQAVLSRLKQNKIVKAKEYAELLDSLHSDYKAELESQNRIDFDDMIIRSTNAIVDGTFKPRWRHILVDEFQDISMARMDFLKALVSYGPDPILTVVGDDWQSIYRFSGGKLELTTRFEELVGSHSLTKLEKTFRYNNSIAETAGTFVMQNPEQYKKNVVTNEQVNTSQVHLLDCNAEIEDGLENRILDVIRTIKNDDPDGSIAVLARYRYLLKNAKEKVDSESVNRNIKYWTFHGSKGLEADYCILVGFSQGKMGFPNLNKEEAVIEALLPSLDKYPHSEERRLLYVAITRAKKKCYLIADPMAPSEFITELLTPKYDLNIVSERFEEKHRKIYKCPVCTDGYFRLRAGQYGNFYSCTSGSVCQSKPRICEQCGSPSIDIHGKSICNNQDCGSEKILCDLCGRPMKLRNGKYGPFLGCTGYGIEEDQCKNTRKYV